MFKKIFLTITVLSLLSCATKPPVVIPKPYMPKAPNFLLESIPEMKRIPIPSNDQKVLISQIMENITDNNQIALDYYVDLHIWQDWYFAMQDSVNNQNTRMESK